MDKVLIGIAFHIVETHDDEGRIALVSEKQMCEILGLREEETHVDEGQMNEQGVDTEGAAIPTSDAIPSGMVISYYKNKPQWILVQYTKNGGVHDGSATICYQ